MTHREACKALAANAHQYGRKAISFEVWSREVDRVLELRFPGEPFRRFTPRRVPLEVQPSFGSS